MHAGDSNFQTQFLEYGGAPIVQKSPSVRAARSRLNLVAVCQCLIVPSLLFAMVFGVMSFSLHYTQPGLCYFIVFCGGMVVLASGLLAYSAVRRAEVMDEEPTWFLFVFFTLLIAYSLAIILGDANFWCNMQPYYDIQNLNTYRSVDPSAVSGQQLMDAGHIFFSNSTKLDLRKSGGFRTMHGLWCVAPVTSGDTPLSSYDFWAVGRDCCSGTAPDFHCGEYKGRERAGLRLMDDEQRAFFRLAVQQAEATFHIKASHPVFLYWMADPVAETEAYRDSGLKHFTVGLLLHFSFQLCCVSFATYAFSNKRNYLK